MCCNTWNLFLFVLVTVSILAWKQVFVLNHPFYSSDLHPCDYFLFPKLKLFLKREVFQGTEDIQTYKGLSYFHTKKKQKKTASLSFHWLIMALHVLTQEECISNNIHLNKFFCLFIFLYKYNMITYCNTVYATQSRW